MRLLNLRLGFACNSSSTHSILLDSRLVTSEYEDFGWDQFQIESKDISHYIYAALCQKSWRIDPELPAYDKEEIRVALGFDELPDGEGYVDHQSCPVFVLNPVTKKIDPEFVKELRAWFQSNGVGVHGGNDNDESSFPPKSDKSYPYTVDESDMIGRKSGDIWTMIDRSGGKRIRMTFSDSPRPSIMPELVDLKITNFCTYGCRYCYQASTKLGQHSDIENLKQIIDQLSDCGVLEVAIGGGEPTLHPQFREIVEYADSRGVIPNVTTRNLSFLKEVVADKWPQIGGVAFSVDNEDGARKVAGAVMLAGHDCRQRITAQIVDKSVTYKSWLIRMLDVLEEARVRVTWLGYKQTGFGKKYLSDKWNTCDWSFADDVLTRNQFRRMASVDTAIIAEYKDILKDRYSAYDMTATEDEGVTSCYIDAVEQKIGISSYHEDTFVSFYSLKEQFASLR